VEIVGIVSLNCGLELNAEIMEREMCDSRKLTHLKSGDTDRKAAIMNVSAIEDRCFT
jgi:hypothetical protein